MRRCVSIPIVAALLLSACRPIPVRVGKRIQDMEVESSLPQSASIDTKEINQWNTVEDFLSHLEAIKDLGREALLKRYHKDGRQQIRMAFRRFRDAVEVQASRESQETLPYITELELDVCVPIHSHDILGLDAYGELGTVLETSFLSRLQPSQSLPKPGVPSGIDAITKLGFFELGLVFEGQSFYTKESIQYKQGSNLRWKVIHEQNDPLEWKPYDSHEVVFEFLRVESQDASEFTLEAKVEDLENGKVSEGSLPTLRIEYRKNISKEGSSTQVMFMQTGWRHPTGHWQTLQLSRRIEISQDLAMGRILHVLASEQWQKPEAIHKKFRLDLDTKQLCSELGGL